MGRRLVRPGSIPEREDRRKPKPKPAKKKGDPRVRSRAEKLHESGMPFQMAMAVAHGRLELNEALERMARSDRIDQLMKRHELSRALATQIAIGQASLDRVLYRRRMDGHRAENRLRSVLTEAWEAHRELCLLLHQVREVCGTVVGVDAYSVTVEVEGEPEEIHKLQVKAAFWPEAQRRVHKALEVDDALRAEPKTPIERPQDRYPCSDKRLFRYLDGEVEVVATLLEGDRLAGVVDWFGRYEFGLRIPSGDVVTLFRHALHDLKEP